MKPLPITGDAPQLSQIYNFWKEFELEEFRGKMDKKGLAIAEKQETSVESRRKLAETTKDFRRTANSETVKQVGTLLKSYQSEVDQLTSRATFGESAFLDVYQKLYDAPDPAPPLATALEMASHSSELEAHVRKLAQELSEYKAESKELKNQDGTIRRLEERVRSLEAQLQEKDRQLEEAAAAVEAAGNLQAAQETAGREQALLAALSEAQSSLGNMKKLHDASQKQLFSMQSRSEEEQAGLQREVDIATAEMERAQHRLMSIEKEKEALKEQVSSAGGKHRPAPAGISKATEDSLRVELSAQRQLVSRLHSEMNAVSIRAEEESSTWSSRCEGLRSALQAQEAHAEALERELSTRPSTKQVEELRQQLRLLQAVGFGSLETEDGQPAESSGPGVMEAMLLDKNRKLEHQVTMARLQLAEASGEAETASARIGELESDVEAKAELIARLEEDLLAAKPSTKLAAAADTGQANGLAEPQAEDAAEPQGGERTMLSVLCSQRDRFRKRVSELEEEVAQVLKELKAAKRDLEGARADSVALVERLRYVQGYQATSRTRNDVESGQIENKYATAYEERMNPFSDWKEREKASRKRQLNVADRVMYEFGQFISSSQKARVFVVVYTVALHLLIFWVLARWGHGPAHHFSGSELQLLCDRHAHDAASESRHQGLVDSSFGRRP